MSRTRNFLVAIRKDLARNLAPEFVARLMKPIRANAFTLAAWNVFDDSIPAEDRGELDMTPLDHEMIAVTLEQMASGRSAISACGKLQCITTYFGCPEHLSVLQRARGVVASGIRVANGWTSAMQPVFRWPHVCELAKAMGYHRLHLSGVDRREDIQLLASSVIRSQAIHLGCQAWVFLNAADGQPEKILQTETLLAAARNLCRRTPSRMWW